MGLGLERFGDFVPAICARFKGVHQFGCSSHQISSYVACHLVGGDRCCAITQLPLEDDTARRASLHLCLVVGERNTFVRSQDHIEVVQVRIYVYRQVAPALGGGVITSCHQIRAEGCTIVHAFRESEIAWGLRVFTVLVI